MAKRILFVVPYVPNLIRVRPYNLIRHLAELGHEITLLTLWSDDEEKASLEFIQPYVRQVVAVRLRLWRSLWNCLMALPSRKPLQSVYCWEPALADELARVIGDQDGKKPYDVVHVEHLRGAPYGLYLKNLFAMNGGSTPPVVWDSVDSISLLFRKAAGKSKSLFGRSVTRLELGRTERYEGWLLNQFDHVTVTSQVDKQALLSLTEADLDEGHISVIPNGVDLDYFRPQPGVERHDSTLILTGKMSYHANVSMVLFFVQEVMPLIWEKSPATKLWVVGKDPTREILALNDHANILITGTVEHLPPYLQEATISVAPIPYGVGIQNKVLEAMACEIPVVASSQAVSALQVRSGDELLVADAPREYTRVILDLLKDENARYRIGKAGRRYVERHHHWLNVAQNLSQVYEKAERSTAG
jgi:glycosyltransferase involved in cell wall biosynthesis